MDIFLKEGMGRGEGEGEGRGRGGGEIKKWGCILQNK